MVIGLSIFLMVSLDVAHAPAGGTALGVSMADFSLTVLLTIISSTVILGLAHHYLKKYLKDLV